jgi:hypothetical protein
MVSLRRILISLRVDRALLAQPLRGFGIARPDEVGFHRHGGLWRAGVLARNEVKAVELTSRYQREKA